MSNAISHAGGPSHNFLQERQSNHSSDKDRINEGIFNTLWLTNTLFIQDNFQPE